MNSCFRKLPSYYHLKSINDIFDLRINVRLRQVQKCSLNILSETSHMDDNPYVTTKHSTSDSINDVDNMKSSSISGEILTCIKWQEKLPTPVDISSLRTKKNNEEQVIVFTYIDMEKHNLKSKTKININDSSVLNAEPKHHSKAIAKKNAHLFNRDETEQVMFVMAAFKIDHTCDDVEENFSEHLLCKLKWYQHNKMLEMTPGISRKEAYPIFEAQFSSILQPYLFTSPSGCSYEYFIESDDCSYTSMEKRSEALNLSQELDSRIDIERRRMSKIIAGSLPLLNPNKIQPYQKLDIRIILDSIVCNDMNALSIISCTYAISSSESWYPIKDHDLSPLTGSIHSAKQHLYSRGLLQSIVAAAMMMFASISFFAIALIVSNFAIHFKSLSLVLDITSQLVAIVSTPLLL